MKQHEESRLNPRLSDWDEVWALVMPFILQLSLALILICVLAVAARSTGGVARARGDDDASSPWPRLVRPGPVKVSPALLPRTLRP